MPDKIVLVVSDEKDGKRGEISVLDTAHEAERVVETLLEAGFEQDRVRLFEGSQAEFVTVYRPVVDLIEEANQRTEPDGPASDRAEPEVVEAGSGIGRGREGRRISSPFRSNTDDKLELYMTACEAAS